MTTSCAIVDCSVKDGANIAQRDRKVKRWLPVGPLPEGMAFSGSLQCRICRSCFQRINRYQSEERERREDQPTLRSQVPLPTPSQKARKQDEVSSLRSSSASTEQLPTDDDSNVSAKRLRSSSSLSSSATTTPATTTPIILRSTMELPPTQECAGLTNELSRSSRLNSRGVKTGSRS